MILNIKNRNRGYYIRWYNDGWHTWFFRAVDETLTTQGQLHKTNVVYSFTMGDDALNKAELYAISGLLKAIYIQIYTSDGWQACTIDSETFPLGQNYRNGANVQFNIKVWAKIGMFSPVVPVRIIPALLMVGTFTQFIATSTTDSDSQTFTVTAKNCLTDVIVTAPTSYLISLDEVTWASSLTLELQGVNVPTTTIYIKLEANPQGDYDGNITATTTGASDTLAVDGIVNYEPEYSAYAIPPRSLYTEMYDELYANGLGDLLGGYDDFTPMYWTNEKPGGSDPYYVYWQDDDYGYANNLTATTEMPARKYRTFTVNTSVIEYDVQDLMPSGGYIFYKEDLGSGDYKYYEAAVTDSSPQPFE